MGAIGRARRLRHSCRQGRRKISGRRRTQFAEEREGGAEPPATRCCQMELLEYGVAGLPLFDVYHGWRDSGHVG